MMTPGPDHPITVDAATTRWRAEFNGHVIADSNEAVVLKEADYRPVVYFPREDVSMDYMARTERTSHCPYKGDAAYYTLRMDSQIAEDVAWSYETPFEAMGRISGRIAFYPDRVEVYPVADAAVNPHHTDDMARSEVDAIVQHTDSGGGASQREHWEPNVETPNRDGGLR